MKNQNQTVPYQQNMRDTLLVNNTLQTQLWKNIGNERLPICA